ncbi:Hsp20/alpha crystallin family protein [Gimesia panareensis]|uniref:Spore protein SP21 n=1 Tax=Gimesia panareensis TaxID=2527978 RepID=A0A517QF52_9PLAN|nr:Hsp20/alpha crystallin family protein [Gimesia panareensis]QDT30270.1 Spore protein SP21 [Gimesia panareensis]QDU53345.1 Spore protein SP21 [Gimesia panareensis]
MSSADQQDQPDPVHIHTEEASTEQTQTEQSQTEQSGSTQSESTESAEEKRSDASGIPNSIERLRSEFDKLLGVAVEQGERALDRLGLFGNEPVWVPRVDLMELEEQVQVTMDLPGVTAEEINITLAGNMLTVTGTRSTGTTTTAGQTVRMSERPSGQFRRSVPMPVAVDPDKVTASVQNGILSITLDKASTEKPRQIPINSASGTSF